MHLLSKVSSSIVLSDLSEHRSSAALWVRGWGPGVWPMTLKFELSLDFLTTHLPTKFPHPMFNHSEVIVLTNKQTNKDILLKTSILLCYSTPVENNPIAAQKMMDNC